MNILVDEVLENGVHKWSGTSNDKTWTLGDTYYSGKGASHGKDSKSNKRRFGLRPVDR